MDLRVVLDTDVNVNHPLAATDILRRKRPAASLRKPLWWLLHLVEPKTTQSAQWRAALVICTAECAACLLRPERQSCTTVLTKINQGTHVQAHVHTHCPRRYEELEHEQDDHELMAGQAKLHRRRGDVDGIITIK